MSSSSFVALSRTARAGAHGKNDHRRWVLDMHIFGRLHVAHDPIVGDEAAGGSVLNGASLGARPDGGR